MLSEYFDNNIMELSFTDRYSDLIERKGVEGNARGVPEKACVDLQPNQAELLTENHRNHSCYSSPLIAVNIIVTSTLYYYQLLYIISAGIMMWMVILTVFLTVAGASGFSGNGRKRKRKRTRKRKRKRKW